MGGWSFFKRIVLEAVAPVQKVLSASVHGYKDAWLRYVLLVGIEEENKNLKNKINEFKSTLIYIKRVSEAAKDWGSFYLLQMIMITILFPHELSVESRLRFLNDIDQ